MVTTIFFAQCVFISPQIWTLTPALPVFSGVMFALTVIFMLLTTGTDPGIIPRRNLLQITNNGQVPSQFTNRGIEELFLEELNKEDGVLGSGG